MIKERLNLSDEDVKMCKQIGFRTLSLCSIMEMEKMQALAYVRVMIPVINRYYHTQEERIEGYKRHWELFNTTPTVAALSPGYPRRWKSRRRKIRRWTRNRSTRLRLR